MLWNWNKRFECRLAQRNAIWTHPCKPYIWAEYLTADELAGLALAPVPLEFVPKCCSAASQKVCISWSCSLFYHNFWSTFFFEHAIKFRKFFTARLRIPSFLVFDSHFGVCWCLMEFVHNYLLSFSLNFSFAGMCAQSIRCWIMLLLHFRVDDDAGNHCKYKCKLFITAWIRLILFQLLKIF